MATPCFYYSHLRDRNPKITLSDEESAHALQSRRLRVNSEVKLIDGAGCIASGEINEVGRRQVSVVVNEFVNAELPLTQVTMAVAMPKGDRQKVLVDMLTQMGVSKLIPIESERSISQLKERQLDKLRRVSLEACKQSHNPWAMAIEQPMSFEHVLNVAETVYYADIGGVLPQELPSLPSSPMIIIGPEGGLSPREFELLMAKNAQAITLGQHILRTETAAIAAAAMFAR